MTRPAAVGGFKSRHRRPDTPLVDIERCPYDGAPIDVETYSGGSFLLSCPACGAAWEAHNAYVRRVQSPDWGAARAERAAREAGRPARSTGGPRVDPDRRLSGR